MPDPSETGTIKYTHLFQDIINENTDRKLKFDSLRDDQKSCYVQLRLKNEVELNIKVLEEKNIIKDTLVNGKIKNGMFLLDNKKSKIYGIPYLLGGYDIKKQRIGVTNKNNLITNISVAKQSLLLFVIGRNYNLNLSYEYERME